MLNLGTSDDQNEASIEVDDENLLLLRGGVVDVEVRSERASKGRREEESAGLQHNEGGNS